MAFGAFVRGQQIGEALSNSLACNHIRLQTLLACQAQECCKIIGSLISSELYC